MDYLEAADNERKRRRENDEPVSLCEQYVPFGFTCKEAGFAQENWCEECKTE
jgi:hypothetical protein